MRSSGEGHREAQPHESTNYTRDPVRQYAREAGADAVFYKSFDMEALEQYVASLSRRGR